MSGDGGSISASVCLVMEGPLVPLCVSGDGGSISASVCLVMEGPLVPLCVW